MRAKLELAESLESPGPMIEAILAMATEHRMWVVAGGLPERAAGDPGAGPDAAGGERVYNTCVVVDPEGQIRGAYRKIHLFDVHIPGRAELMESAATAPGRDLVVCDSPLGRLGLSVCYDVRFPELYRELAARGAELLMVPAAFTAHTGAAHWHTLLKARAIENQCFVVAPAQVGRHNPARESYGHSIIIDPWGEVLAERPDGVGLAVAEIDLARLHEVRSQMPCQSHRVLGRAGETEA